ncbi:unnamed protein product, partial [Symbiodinium sp. CCMP2592]
PAVRTRLRPGAARIPGSPLQAPSHGLLPPGSRGTWNGLRDPARREVGPLPSPAFGGGDGRAGTLLE